MKHKYNIAIEKLWNSLYMSIFDLEKDTKCSSLVRMYSLNYILYHFIMADNKVKFHHKLELWSSFEVDTV